MGALLLFVALLFTGAAADDAAHCVIETCSGCRLNRLPKLKAFITTGVRRFPAVTVKYVPGKSPILVCYDASEHKTLTQDIAHLDEDGMVTLLAAQGIDTSTPKHVRALDPTPEDGRFRTSALERRAHLDRLRQRHTLRQARGGRQVRVL